MTGFFGAAARFLALFLVVGFAALVFLPSADGPLLAGIAAPDPAPSPCKKQHWPNVERRCLWSEPKRELGRTAANRDGAKAEGAKRETASPAIAKADAAPLTTAENEPGAPPLASLVAAEAPAAEHGAEHAARREAAAANAAPIADAPPAARPALRKTEKPRPLRIAPAGEGIPIAVVRADGSRRTVLIRPTSPQDVYYYSQRSIAGTSAAARL